LIRKWIADNALVTVGMDHRVILWLWTTKELWRAFSLRPEEKQNKWENVEWNPAQHCLYLSGSLESGVSIICI
jgi:hypothetical protein